jgi:predicted nucleic acid-binding Zn ribbon protein
VTTWKPSRPRKSEIEPRHVADSLDRATRRIGAPRTAVLTEVFSRWEQVVGPDIAAHAQPRSLRDGVLVIAVDQPAWASQLRFLGADLLARISDATGCCDVAEIQVKVVGEPTRKTRQETRR